MPDLLETLFLKYSPMLSGIRRVPWLRDVAHRVSCRVLPPDRLVWVQVRKGWGEGLWLKLNLRTAYDYYEGRVEPGMQKILAEYLRPGMVFYDLGANLGVFSLLAARLVGSTGRVFAFEADPEVGQRLKENVERNGSRNVQVVDGAVWSSTGSVAFSRADESTSPERGWGKVVSSVALAERKIQIPCISLDDFVRSETPPDFIKCDVEGAEYEVFQGARELLAAHRPLIACAVHSNHLAGQLTEFFAEIDYDLNWFVRNHLLAIPRHVG